MTAMTANTSATALQAALAVASPDLLGPELTIPHAAAIRDRLLAAMAAQDADEADFTLDLGPVGECDSSGVQLLLATRRSLRNRGGRLRLLDAGAAVRDALTTFGLTDLLDEDANHAP
jgi:anti-anti-sigma factor